MLGKFSQYQINLLRCRIGILVGITLIFFKHIIGVKTSQVCFIGFKIYDL